VLALSVVDHGFNPSWEKKIVFLLYIYIYHLPLFLCNKLFTSPLINYFVATLIFYVQFYITIFFYHVKCLE